MPVFEDWLKSPVSIINNIFESDPVNFECKIQEYFEDKIKNEKNYFSIPCLNDVPIHELTPNCLVRYRCMIQDAFDPVYYTGVQRLRNKTTGEICYMTLKYKETLDIPDGYEIHGDIAKEDLMKVYGKSMEDCSEQSQKTNLHQRMTFYCVPIPGETDWVKQTFQSNGSGMSSVKSLGSSSNTSHRPVKRTIEPEQECEEGIRENVEKMSLADMKVVCKEKNEDTTICKICLKYKSKTYTDGTETESKTETKTINYTKKTKTEETEERNVNVDSLANLTNSFPLSNNESGVPCLVKTYDYFENFKLNDLVEFIGILSQDPSLAYMYDEHKDYLEVEHAEKVTEYKIHQEKKMETEDHHICKCSEMDISVTKFTTHSKKVILSEFPPSLVPRLHCIKFFSLLSNNPLLTRHISVQKNEEMECDNKENKKEEQMEYWNMEYSLFLKSLLNEANLSIPDQEGVLFETAQIYLNKLRNEIIMAFQEILLGDGLAAEYLLMHLLSLVYMRRDVTVLGKFTLNFNNIPQTLKSPTQVNAEKEDEKVKAPKSFSDCFFECLKKIIPMGHIFKLTVENLNKSNLIPNKDYNKDKLLSGMLQLPDGFNLFIDETELISGELNSKGLMNVNSIKEIIKWQKMNYDFSFHQQEFNTNLRVLVLSEKKSLLPFDFQIKLNHSLDHFEADKYELITSRLFNDSTILNNIRKYFTILSHLDYKLNQPMQQLVEDDIVKIRQTPIENRKEKMSIEDFHLLLVVARLQTLSYGKTELSLPEWNRAKSLEIERLKNRVLN